MVAAGCPCSGAFCHVKVCPAAAADQLTFLEMVHSLQFFQLEMEGTALQLKLKKARAKLHCTVAEFSAGQQYEYYGLAQTDGRYTGVPVSVSLKNRTTNPKIACFQASNTDTNCCERSNGGEKQEDFSWPGLVDAELERDSSGWRHV